MAGVGPVRDRKKQSRWRRIVRGQAGSGLSVRAYCLREGVKESAYYWWRAQLARRDAESLRSPTAFVPVEVVAEEPTRGAGEGSGQIEILWPGGWKVRVSGRVDRQTLADVLASLGGAAMLKLPSLGELDQGMAVRIYLCVQPTDMRKGFDTLAASVKEFLRHDPFSGNLFLFVSRGKDRLKILSWDRDGFCLWYKRLEEGTFKLPSNKDAPVSVELKATELAMLLEGIDLKSIKRSKRFSRPVASIGVTATSV